MKPSQNAGSARSPRGPRTLDVRAMIANGGQPFPEVMSAVGELADGESLRLITPFLPSPLIERLQGDGFRAAPERRGDGAWQTTFTRC
jgi:uncharacterized protein (DUF2249 family)